MFDAKLTLNGREVTSVVFAFSVARVSQNVDVPPVYSGGGGVKPRVSLLTRYEDSDKIAGQSELTLTNGSKVVVDVSYGALSHLDDLIRDPNHPLSGQKLDLREEAAAVHMKNYREKSGFFENCPSAP